MHFVSELIIVNLKGSGFTFDHNFANFFSQSPLLYQLLYKVRNDGWFLTTYLKKTINLTRTYFILNKNNWVIVS